MKSPHSQGLVSPNGAMQWPSRAHLEGKITVQVIYNIHIPNFIRFKCCTASGWQPWPLTAVIFKIPDSREKKQVKKEYTFQFLISFLTQYIAGLSELLAAKWPLVMRVNHRTLFQLTDTKKLVTMWSMKIDQILPSPNQLYTLFRDHSDRWPGATRRVVK